MLKIIPIGGLGEIGLNMMVLEYGDCLVVIDVGLMFPEDYMLGVDFVIPDMAYLVANKHKVAAVILTHAHEDHIGALPYLLKNFQVPVYGTAFTLGMVRHKLEEHGLLTQISLNVIRPDDVLPIGPFSFSFIRVNHSVVDGVALAIETPVGRVVHTGDFKLSETTIPGMETDIDAFAECGGKGVLALMSDSTNVEKDGKTMSDYRVRDTLNDIISRSRGRVIVALFASNISRIQQIISICAGLGRRVIINGRSIEFSVMIAEDLGLLEIPPGIQATVDEHDSIDDDKTVVLTTGSQGEPMSALVRMAAGFHKQITIKAGDTVVLSSKFIPGNEKAIAKIINNLFRKGAEVIYEKISDIHVSGHAFRDELEVMMALTRPTYFIPIHGEYRHLYHHAKLAEAHGIPVKNILLAEDGQIISFDETGGRIDGQIPTSRVLVDGNGIGDVGRLVLKERRLLSEDGMVVVTLALDLETGILVYGPEIMSKGFVFGDETGHILEEAKCIVFELLDALADKPGRAEAIRRRLPSALREYFNFTIRRKPVILPFILEV